MWPSEVDSGCDELKFENMEQYVSLFGLINDLSLIVKRAADAILEVYAGDSYGIKVKTDDSPVTLADLAANDIICEGLAALQPSFPFLSEENMEIPYAERSNYEYVWLIDPLDGTKEFVKKNGQFTINVSLIHHNRPVLGMVYVPVEQALYYAVAGQGAFLELPDKPVCRLQCGKIRLSDKGLRIPCSLSHINSDTKNFIQQFDEAVLMPRGSALKFMMLATAEADVYPRLAPTMEWDTAAPQIILEEAGGKVLNVDTMEPLTYNKESLVNPGFVAYSTVIAD